MTMRRLLREESGYAVVTAISLLVIMLGVGLTLMGTVDMGQKRVHEDRNRESALNLAEGVLYSQGFTLAASWPGTAGTMPTGCTEGTGTTTGCPNPNYLASANSGNGLANFTTVDFQANVQWQTRVRDNGAPLTVYSTANADLPQQYRNPITGQMLTCGSPCTWDANGDRQMWVQAKAVVRGKPRNVVALLRLEQIRINAPTSAVISGGIIATNNGTSHVFADASGSQIITRCDPQTNSACAVYQSGQMSPPPDDRPGTPTSLLTPAQIEGLKQVAITNGTYHETCPPGGTSPDLRGAVVFIGNCNLKMSGSSYPDSGACSPAAPAGMGTTCVNQYGRAGIVVWQCGKVEFEGNKTYVGLFYMVNGSNGACPSIGSDPVKCEKNVTTNDVFTTNGGFGVWGAVAIDGNGCLKLGSNGTQIKYDANVFNNLASFGTVGLVQNTWRELRPND